MKKKSGKHTEKNKNRKKKNNRKLNKANKKKKNKNSRKLQRKNTKKKKKLNKKKKQRAKERKRKQRKRKHKLRKNDGRNSSSITIVNNITISSDSSSSSSSSTGCPDLACINNAGTALKLEKDQISNFIKQKSRVENYMKTVNGKLSKKGQFEADAASLKSALGGNLDNATCGGSAQRTVSAAAKVPVY